MTHESEIMEMKRELELEAFELNALHKWLGEPTEPTPCIVQGLLDIAQAVPERMAWA